VGDATKNLPKKQRRAVDLVAEKTTRPDEKLVVRKTKTKAGVRHNKLIVRKTKDEDESA
jgi:hypothetical protein